MYRSEITRSKTDKSLKIYARGLSNGTTPINFPPPRFGDQQVQVSDDRRPAPVASGGDLLAENFRNMKIESNTYQSNKNNNAAKPSMEHHHSTPRYDLYPQYSNFPIRDSNNMHNNYTVPPALVQKKFPRVNERICNYDETYFNVASAQNPDLGSIGDSFFTDQSIRIIPYIPHKDLLSERLMRSEEPSEESGYHFNFSDFPPLPPPRNAINFRPSITAIGKKPLRSTSGADSALNRFDGMPILDKVLNERINDKDHFEKTANYRFKNPIRGLSHKPCGYLQDQFGLLGIVSYMRELQNGDANLSILTQGYYLPTLHKFVNERREINPVNAGPFAENPLELHNDDFTVPSEYICQHKIRDTLAQPNLTLYNDDTLFFLFYQFPGEMMQLMAADKLRERNWRFYKGFSHWVCYAPDNEIVKTSRTHEKAIYIVFHQIEWKKCRERLVLQYSLFEKPEEYQYYHN